MTPSASPVAVPSDRPIVSGRRIGDRAVSALSRRAGRAVTRRSFLVRVAIFASALVVNPLRYLLRPGSAYASLCGPDASCASGWTAFCCTVNGGQNSCPPGSSRVVTCVAPWEFDATCTTTSATANATALHDAPCLHEFSSSVLAFGAAADHGEPKGALAVPIVGMESTPTGLGYWLVAADGGVFTFGDARFRGSLGDQHLNAPIVDLARTPLGAGYWLVASDGGVFGFGDARFRGSMGRSHLNRPIVGMAATPSGKGYWLVASDGGVFCFGDAGFHGSMGGSHLNRPIVGMAASPTGRGYWMVASDGGIFSFGDAHFAGSAAGLRLNRPIVGMAVTPSGNGYWFVAADGGINAFGDARFLGSGVNRPHAGRGTDIAARPDGRGYWIATDT